MMLWLLYLVWLISRLVENLSYPNVIESQI